MKFFQLSYQIYQFFFFNLKLLLIYIIQFYYIILENNEARTKKNLIIKLCVSFRVCLFVNQFDRWIPINYTDKISDS